MNTITIETLIQMNLGFKGVIKGMLARASTCPLNSLKLPMLSLCSLCTSSPLSKEISLVGSWDRRAWLKLIKVVFSLPLISNNRYKLTTPFTLISVVRYKDWVRLGLDILPGQFRLLYRLSDIRIGLNSRSKTYRRHAILRVHKVGKGRIG
jgi:hypothetical protein